MLFAVLRYVESLENRLEKMEKLLHRLMPSADLAQELEKIEDETPEEPSLLPRNDTDLQEEELIGKLKRLHVDPPQGRFFGKSRCVSHFIYPQVHETEREVLSGYQLVQTALDIQREYVGKQMPARVLQGQRTQFWFVPTWHPERFQLPPPPVYTYPDGDLILSLVNSYFDVINPFLPLFHRPSFERSVVEGLHYHDPSFGGTLLLVCALGSRYSDDPRVFYEGTTSTHSVGWKWFEQVPILRRSFLPPPSLSELQNFALAILFATSSETPQGCWTQLGLAMRMAQEVGAHRRRTLKAPTAEDELWKRAFCHDVDLPIECDDEYWEHSDPAIAFTQPPDKPSSISFFNCYIRLMDIMAYAMRAIAPPPPPPPQYSVKRNVSGQQTTYTDQKIIMEIDSKLNDWMDSVPDHLRWDPTSKNKIFLQQSATLYATYYHITIFTAAVVLMLNIWSGKRSGVAPHPQRELDDVQRCLKLLETCESRDILLELASAGDLNLPREAAAGTKRSRDSEAIPESPSVSFFSSPREPLKASQGTSSPTVDVAQDSAAVPLNFELPMYGNELGRLPVYGQFNFSESHKRPRRDALDSTSGFQAFEAFVDPVNGSSFAAGQIPQNITSADLEWSPFSTIQTREAPETLYIDQSKTTMDSDTLAMWSTAPTGFEINEWGTYINTVEHMTHSPENFFA
ncbi:hypothetical protein H0H93_006646 [Arthromyces matolae]|nr:hypothetical protein H0H93_006646 [Arthromyces matolae]